MRYDLIKTTQLKTQIFNYFFIWVIEAICSFSRYRTIHKNKLSVNSTIFPQGWKISNKCCKVYNIVCKKYIMYRKCVKPYNIGWNQLETSQTLRKVVKFTESFFSVYVLLSLPNWKRARISTFLTVKINHNRLFQFSANVLLVRFSTAHSEYMTNSIDNTALRDWGLDKSSKIVVNWTVESSYLRISCFTGK